MRQLLRLQLNSPHNFNSHTPRGVRRAGGYIYKPVIQHFNSHTPRGVRPIAAEPRPEQETHFNTHTPRGVRLDNLQNSNIHKNISTHTPLAGCDAPNHLNTGFQHFISTHTPLAGCDLAVSGYRIAVKQFQLTHPSRGATDIQLRTAFTSPDFNSHTPRGVRRQTNK